MTAAFDILGPLNLPLVRLHHHRLERRPQTLGYSHNHLLSSTSSPEPGYIHCVRPPDDG